MAYIGERKMAMWIIVAMAGISCICLFYRCIREAALSGLAIRWWRFIIFAAIIDVPYYLFIVIKICNHEQYGGVIEQSPLLSGSALDALGIILSLVFVPLVLQLMMLLLSVRVRKGPIGRVLSNVFIRPRPESS